ncbi:MAG TPA: molecular chaperone HtpG [Bacteroidales bacterium]|nr:molecular chaperone HtpG [Bacteroidales bacterium]HPY21787.1 molecular chaperone HtpG [Bacteroidales bacterium]HQA92949.1 molecular chaperone HtpG [Bacteroidales bacterium]HQP79299.1 molecular chaperone HtpG [Bacteroidales bacterium]
MAKGTIGVTTENIFPVIKKFLYSDHEIFIRELVANAVDATQKLNTIANSGEFKGELGDLTIRIDLDPKEGTLKITDRGIGMTAEEVDKYINQIAFSSAGEFLEKYKDQAAGIIGYFGLGFYSAFMVSKKVTIDTLSWKEGSKAVRWECEGDPEYTMSDSDKQDRGTTITLHLDDDAKDFAQEHKISELLHKYCKFMPVLIALGKKKEWKDGKYVDTDEDNIINSIKPLWTVMPTELKDEDYMEFYRELYPMHDDPLFYIHLNVDYPFNLTGILYFPKIKNQIDVVRNKIQLFCNQMFVTDSVENIVPEFMTLLHGVIDSPDIPLNVSRSYLQSDANVKKISGYITRKVADRLEEISKNNKEEFESKWDNLKLFIEYGMITDEKFNERALNFALFKNTDGKYFNYEDYRKAIATEQTNKDGKVVYLYATDAEKQYQYIETAKNKGYDVLQFDSPLDSHFVSMLEQKLENSTFARVDADSIDKLIAKSDVEKYEISEEEQKRLDSLFEEILPKENKYRVSVENLGDTAQPVLITQTEFMRRYRDMAALGGGLNFYGELPETYNIVINAENPLIKRIMGEKGTEAFTADNVLLKQVTDLALLANNMLKGKELSEFIKRSSELL